MATLRGKDAFKDVSLIVTLPAKGTVPGKDGKSGSRYLEIQVDQSLKNPDKIAEGQVQADTNPYLVSYEKEHPQGGKYTSHRDKYWDKQFDAIAAAALDPNPKDPKRPNNKVVHMENGDTVYGITASLTKNSHGNLIIDTNKPMERTHNPHFGKNILEKQDAVTKAARDFRDVQKSAQKEAPAVEKAVEQQAEQPTFEEVMEEPAV